jgi:hypothetical protein
LPPAHHGEVEEEFWAGYDIYFFSGNDILNFSEMQLWNFEKFSKMKCARLGHPKWR